MSPASKCFGRLLHQLEQQFLLLDSSSTDAVLAPAAAAADDDDEASNSFFAPSGGRGSCSSGPTIHSRIVLPALRAYLASILSETDGCLKAQQAS
ncbi:uncharacterized protein LOC6533236 isoform X2 [Drosophila yakuba]|uniref:Uncharacterized protein, isoform C n=1 Tax=Drosophila yakuba TaxID=7245 RepID=A0A0R1DVZ6_DROYA|nr:uncharacterized protein LOC6533236 isoform X2 [Drosophila yakuba]KRK01296.1 uncharacterized protein Dyak_GE21577, isoform C [Drosophila yakuba]